MLQMIVTGVNKAAQLRPIGLPTLDRRYSRPIQESDYLEKMKISENCFYYLYVYGYIQGVLQALR